MVGCGGGGGCGGCWKAAMNENKLHYSSQLDVDRLILGWEISSLSVPIELLSSSGSATAALSSTYFNLLLFSLCLQIQKALEKTLQETYQRLCSSEGYTSPEWDTQLFSGTLVGYAILPIPRYSCRALLLSLS